MIAAEEASWRRTSDLVPRRISGTNPLRAMTDPGTIPARPPAEVLHRSRSRALAACIAAGFIAVFALILWLARDPDVAPPAPRPVANEVHGGGGDATVARPAPPPAASEVSPTPPPPVISPPPLATANTNAAAQALVPEPNSARVPIVRPPPVTRAPDTRRFVRPVQRAAPPQRETPAAKPPPPAAPPPAPPAATKSGSDAPAKLADCNPPYYFENNKKIFKPACL